MQVKDQAICLRTVNYSETSQIVTLLTAEHGKIGAMAKGSRRKKSSFDGPIEIFSFGEVMFTIKEHGGQLAMLTEFQQRPRFRAFATNLKILNAGLFAAELTEAFLEDHDPHPKLFVKLIKFLETLQEAESDEHILAWLILYQLRLLEETGVGLSLDECVNCGTSIKLSPCQGGVPRRGEGVDRMGTAHPTIYFSSRSNGILCGGCDMAFAEKQAIDFEMLDILQNPGKLPKADMKQLKAIVKLLIYHLTELLHRPPRMAKYFR